jgi:YidC/Oxa1 family membrane protein insertase
MLVTAYLLILAWNKDHPASSVATAAVSAPVVTTGAGSDLPPTAHATTPINGDVPPTAAAAAIAPAVAAPVEGLIEIQTDVYRLLINPRGGDVVRSELLQHDAIKQQPAPFVLLEQDANRTYVAQSGLIGRNGPDETVAGRPLYQSAQTHYVLAAGQKMLSVPLVYTDAQGVQIIKTYTLTAGAYPIHVGYQVTNRGTQAWQGQLFGQLKRDNSEDPSKSHQGFMAMATYLGGAWGTPDEPYNKLKFADFQDEAIHQSSKGGWVGIVQHYFVSAWIPESTRVVTLESRNTDGMHVIGFRSAVLNVPVGQTLQVSATLYSGPKIQSELKNLATGLNKTVDYGILWPIAQVLFTGLSFIHGLLGNWGWSIILLTFVVKMVLFPLSAKSYRSMAKMKVIAPEMQRMKEEFGEDRMRFSQEMMALYKREQVNPLSGCLPMLMQMPIFLALYWVLMESVELRHAPWMFWIQDLSAMDPWFVLPLIMGATMYGQQMLNPQPADPMQAKMMRLLPIIFTVFLLFFPSGLVLYWIVNNLLTITQQLIIKKEIDKEQARKQLA